ncbi:FAD binding domain protein [Colletotrichum tofieldiae]|nr:FAD binding domain protein [Colletotrichum tofieldiae]
MEKTNNNDTNKLRIVVVGGGIAGLAAAAVLRQRHEVIVYDRDPASAPERGTGIGLGPNGSKMLKNAFQFSPEDVKATVCSGSRTYDKEGNLLREITGVTEPFGSEWLLMHRTDLRDQLLRLATGDAAKLGISGPPATVLDGVEVTGVDVDAGRARDIFKGYPPAIDPSNGGFFNMMTVTDETNRNIIFYPCRNFTTLNVIARIPDSMLSFESMTSWNAEGSSEEMLDHFFDFAPWILEIMKHAEDIHLYKVKDAAPLPTYTRGRAVVVGDAAHPMTPFQGQGATQAVEDAEGLRLLLHESIDADNVSHTLRTWDSVRRPRASQVQQNSRHVTDMSAQAQLDRMRLNWTYSGIHAALRNR